MKKLISMMLSAVLLCSSLLIGCTDTTDEESSASTQTTTVQTVTTEDTEDETEEASEEAEESTEATEETEEETEETVEEDVVGLVTAVDEESITIDVYTTDTEEAIEDYTQVDLDTLVADGTTYEIELTEDVQFYATEDGEYQTIEADAVLADDMIAWITGTDGARWVVRLSDLEEETAEETEEVTEDTEEAESETEETSETDAE